MAVRHRLGALAMFVLAAILVSTSGTVAGARDSTTIKTDVGVLDVGPDLNDGKPLPFAAGSKAKLREAASRSLRAESRRAAATEADVGEEKIWLAVDFVSGFAYLKEYTLRGVGDNIEVWVASDSDEVSSGTDFQPGDCRNGVRTEITDAQVEYLIDQYDDNILPKESDAFSVAPDRSGENAVLDELLGDPDAFPADYWTGDGDDVVALIDNVRDENFYDLNNSEGFTYVAGFFSSQFNELLDRNVMTIDAFDWLHRTTGNPPNEPVPGDNCASAPARPFLYEGVFAHEYQHLLESYEDADEELWVNEGLSDWAQTLTGYVDPATPVTEIGFDSHVQCFLGWGEVETAANPNPRPGGPENSLTVWGDQDVQDSREILCDYGAAYTMMEYLHGKYGTDFMTALHRHDANGLKGLRRLLHDFGVKTKAIAVVHRWAAMAALDAVLDDGARLHGGKAKNLRTPTLDAHINWDNDDTYSFPGAPPNGGDFVRLRDAAGTYLSADQIDSIELEHGDTLPPLPVEWVVDENPLGHAGDPALYSGIASNLDRAIISEVTVPEADPTLTFETLFETEVGFDSGFVQISTDGGETWTSLANDDTATADQLDPGASDLLKSNMPGFNGCSGSPPSTCPVEGDPVWVDESFDLSPWAGQTVLLSFRYITDINTEGRGWWIDDVMLGGDLLNDGTSLEGFQSLTELNPLPIQGFTLQLVAYTDDHAHAWRTSITVRDGHASLTGDEIREAIGNRAETVAAIVMYDENSETITQYAPYRLTVNGVTQPGGGM